MKPEVAQWAKASGIENVYTDYKKILEIGNKRRK